MRDFWQKNQITIITWAVMLVGMAYVGIYRLNAVEEQTRGNTSQITEMGKLWAAQMEMNRNTKDILDELRRRR